MNVRKGDTARNGTSLATYYNTFHEDQTDLHFGDRSDDLVSSRLVSTTVRDSQSDSSVNELNASLYDNTFRRE